MQYKDVTFKKLYHMKLEISMLDYKEIKIRLATEQDVDNIITIVKQAFIQYCTVIGIKTIEALCETEQDVRNDMNTKKIYLAYHNNIPVGTIRIEIKDRKAFISRFSILPEYQSMGIGSNLLSYVDEVLKALQVESVELYSAVQNIQLKNFYIRNGYEIISIDESRGYERGLFKKVILNSHA